MAKQPRDVQHEPRAVVILGSAAFGVILSVVVLGVFATDSLQVTTTTAAQEEGKPPGRHRKGYMPPALPDTVDDDLAASLTPDQWRGVARRMWRRRVRMFAVRVGLLPVTVAGMAGVIVLTIGEWALQGLRDCAG